MEENKKVAIIDNKKIYEDLCRKFSEWNINEYEIQYYSSYEEVDQENFFCLVIRGYLLKNKKVIFYQ